MAITLTEHLFVPLSDGTRLAARLWLPEGAEAKPVPAILEYIPYRKRDGTRARDEPMHGYFAAQGYAVLRVDMRGSGESDGLLDDEYIKLEQDDALEVIAWLAEQSWCDGAVGMMGKSWGGFNCLQVAMRRPPALKAILTVCSTTDRFANDIHYMGGGLLNDNLWWGAIMLAFQARPADPLLRGDDWRAQWIERLNHMPFWPALWLAHQRRDAYWKHGSVCEDWNAIQCPVMAVGGWADSYTNAVPELLEHLTVPRLGLLGPWAHIYPQDGVPTPAIGFLQEATRWWDHWLKGEDRGIMAEPMLRAFVEDGQSPVSSSKPASEGRWRGEAFWPSTAIADTAFYPQSGGTISSQAGAGTTSIRSPLYTGTACGEWMGTGVIGDMPGDQRIDDGLSLTFDSAPLTEDCEILGQPVIDLLLSSDRPLAQMAVRLCDVSPDGASQRISYGVLNLAHRDGSEDPKPMVVGQATPIRIKLKMCGHRFASGHRIRFAISTAYWPILWPAPEAATLSVDLAGSRFTLPVRARDAVPLPVSFAEPAHGPFAPITQLSQSKLGRSVSIDTLTDTATYMTVGEGGLFGEGVFRFDEIDLTLDHGLNRTLTVQADDPLSARSSISQYFDLGREGWQIRIETETAMTGTADEFHLTGSVRAFENGELVVERLYDQSFPRDHL
ncbi:CocE/NonD family hydrolase [Acidisoma cellulosilytica]|uniref:CocE/NonD family hydrolase n=1 Tax=Acidisoma cellulosilyticum TaxID=2802395 RepID=A0A964E4L8_9PROT|nr:CocE/NonD family hydrolase [Acidisoma cellulosilyticum]MCB8881611.1 CocE/NonD family hydrolase [Acidisoma cellulosilyticum]